MYGRQALGGRGRVSSRPGERACSHINLAKACTCTFVHDPPPLRQEGICKSTIKDLTQCAGQKDYVSDTDSWQANSQCVTGAQANTFSKCKGASILFKDSVATNLPAAMGYPAYVAAGVRT